MKQLENCSQMLTTNADFPCLSAADEGTRISKSARGDTESMMRAASKAVRRDGLPSTTLAQIDLNQPGSQRLPSVLRIVPVCRSTWYEGIARGIYPVPIKLGKRSVGWTNQSLKALLQELEGQSKT